MEADFPLVSVIIPVYNAEPFLTQAIESVLAQTYRPLEVIVVDDGSTDGSAAVAASFGDSIRRVRQPNQGAAVARNTGLGMARGAYIAFLDADDWWSDHALQVQVEQMQANPSADIVMGYTQLMQPAAREGGELAFRPFADPWHLLSPGSSLFRRAVFDKVGLFDAAMPPCEDFDWFMRARECGVTIVVHREVVQYYRIHGRNISSDRTRRNARFIAAVKRSLDRRRRQGDGAVAPLPSLFDSPPESGEEGP